MSEIRSRRKNSRNKGQQLPKPRRPDVVDDDPDDPNLDESDDEDVSGSEPRVSTDLKETNYFIRSFDFPECSDTYKLWNT